MAHTGALPAAALADAWLRRFRHNEELSRRGSFHLGSGRNCRMRRRGFVGFDLMLPGRFQWDSALNYAKGVGFVLHSGGQSVK